MYVFLQNWFILDRCEIWLWSSQIFPKMKLILGVLLNYYNYWQYKSIVILCSTVKNDKFKPGTDFARVIKTEALIFYAIFPFKKQSLTRETILEGIKFSDSTYTFWMQHFWGFLHKAASHSRGWYSVVSSLNGEKAHSKPFIYRGFLWCFN